MLKLDWETELLQEKIEQILLEEIELHRPSDSDDFAMFEFMVPLVARRIVDLFLSAQIEN